MREFRVCVLHPGGKGKERRGSEKERLQREEGQRQREERRYEKREKRREEREQERRLISPVPLIHDDVLPIGFLQILLVSHYKLVRRDQDIEPTWGYFIAAAARREGMYVVVSLHRRL